MPVSYYPACYRLFGDCGGIAWEGDEMKGTKQGVPPSCGKETRGDRHSMVIIGIGSRSVHHGDPSPPETRGASRLGLSHTLAQRWLGITRIIVQDPQSTPGNPDQGR